MKAFIVASMPTQAWSMEPCRCFQDKTIEIPQAGHCTRSRPYSPKTGSPLYLGPEYFPSRDANSMFAWAGVSA